MLGRIRASVSVRRVAVLALSLGAIGWVKGGLASREQVPAERADRRAPGPRATAPPMPDPNGAEPGPAGPSGPVRLDPITITPSRHPLDGLSPAELDLLALDPPRSLGTICVGRPNRGRMFNSVPLVSGMGLRVMAPEEHSFGTSSAIATLFEAVRAFRTAHPGAPDVLVGDLSRARGGYLRPHRSHQLGLDADLGYFYRPPARWYTRASASNLDRELTWGLLKALLATGGVEYVFMDRSVQLLLKEHARKAGEAADWVDDLFETPADKDTLVRHTWGHLTHFHVRFFDPTAEASGRRLEKRLRRAGRL